MLRRDLNGWLKYIESVHHRSIDMGLERAGSVLRRLLPEAAPYVTVNIAGTNGKGSSVAMLGSILRSAGYRVGAYTSPHLVRYNERIAIDGEPVSDSLLCDAFEQVEEARDSIPLTYFEFGTLAALLIFSAQRIDAALLEVGMGGRLDAVNLVDADVSLVTNVGFDHTQWLGSDRDAIGAEKAGIYRAGRPAVCGDPQPPPALLDHARRVGARLVRLGVEFGFEVKSRQQWEWRRADDAPMLLPTPSLPGPFQVQNAAAVVMCCHCLPMKVERAQIARGLDGVRLAGRFQRIVARPCEVVLDVAHNPASIEGLKANLAALDHHGRRLAVCGILRDKPVAAMVALLAGEFDAWFIGSLLDGRGATAGEIAEHVRPLMQAWQSVNTYDSVTSAFAAARGVAEAEDRIVVFGSFHTVGDILAQLQ